MSKQFTLQYWIDDDWHVGKVKEVPGVFSQGETLEELEENIKDAYWLMMDENSNIQTPSTQVKELELEL